MSVLKKRRFEMTKRALPWRQAAWIIVLASVLGVCINQFRPDRLPLFADWSLQARLMDSADEFMLVSLEVAKRLCASKKAVFIDARSPEAYRQGHILCAQNLPWETKDEYMELITAGIPLEETIIIYCDGEDCMLSEYVARELFYRGYDHVKVLANGWTRWLEAGLPTGPENGKDSTIAG